MCVGVLGSPQAAPCQKASAHQTNRLLLYITNGAEPLPAAGDWSAMLKLPGGLPARGDPNTPGPILLLTQYDQRVLLMSVKEHFSLESYSEYQSNPDGGSGGQVHFLISDGPCSAGTK